MTRRITTLWRAVNWSKQMQLSGADKRLYVALAAGLNGYCDDARQEFAGLGCWHAVLKVTDAIPMQPAELRRLASGL
jgi:hypothetical protein